MFFKVLKYKILIVLGLLLNTGIYSQETSVARDFELWNSFSLTKKICKKIDLNLEEEFRFYKNASQLDVLFTELSIEYKINKHFDLGVEYRFYRNTKNDGSHEFQKRIRGEITYNHKIKWFRLSYRLSFQDKDENLWLNEETSGESIYNLRNKLSVRYDIKNNKLLPYLATEIFRAYEKNKDPEFNKYRFTAGARYPIFKNTKLELFYRFDKELNVNNLKSSHIIGTGLNYRF